jgi:hypothetical protein
MAFACGNYAENPMAKIDHSSNQKFKAAIAGGGCATAYWWQPQVCGEPVQTPPLGAASPLDPGALKTDNCLSTFLLAHLGQTIFSRADRTMVSK